MNCINCNQPLKDGAAFCPYCGTKQGAPKPAAEQKSFCGNCGSPIAANAAFCANCGAPHKAQMQTQTGGQAFGVKPQAATMRPSSSYAQKTPINPQSGEPRDIVVSFCGEGTAFVFTVLFTVYLLLNVFTKFNIWTIIGSIPSILICIGCWIVWQSCTKNRPNTTGFSLINGALITLEVCWIILFSILTIASIWLLGRVFEMRGQMRSYYRQFGISGGSGEANTITLICVVFFIACVAGIALSVMYYNGIRVTVTSASRIIYGGATEWKTSTLAIVILAIQTVASFIGIFLRSKILSLVWELLYEIGSEFGINMEDMYSSLFRNSWLSVVVTLFSILVSLAALFMLLSIRSKKLTFADRWVAQDNNILK